MLVVFKSAPILKRTLKVKHAMLQVIVPRLSIIFYKLPFSCMCWSYWRCRQSTSAGSGGNQTWKQWAQSIPRSPLRSCVLSIYLWGLSFFLFLCDTAIITCPGEAQAQRWLGLWQWRGLQTMGFPGRLNSIHQLVFFMIFRFFQLTTDCRLRSVPWDLLWIDLITEGKQKAEYFLKSTTFSRYDRGGGGGQERKEVLEGEFLPVDNCINSVLGQEVELSEEFKANYERWLQREVYGTQIDWDQLLEENHLWKHIVAHLMCASQ